MPATPPLSIIIPAHNEQDYIGPCLDALLAQEGPLEGAEVLLMANACTDATVARALPYKRRFAAMGWKLRILRVVTPGKIHALRCSDKAASGRVLAYLDADVICTPPLLAQLAAALDTDAPRYGSGRLQIASAQTWITRQYAATWAALPFMQSPAVGAGLFAMNRAGRARWSEFPDIISDDTFVRLQFSPEERIEVNAAYIWPLVEGFGNLVRVRRRQDAGVEEIDRLYPGLLDREAKAAIDYKALFQRNPVSFICYSAVKLAVKLRRQDSAWTRGR
jgi:glycosyltransferase involved in cell wall biosynthesis